MNYRSKTTAMVLCFFFGLLGAHWFYLGRARWGRMYLAIWCTAWPVALVMMSAFSGMPAIGALFLILAWLVNAGLCCLALYDFCTLLSMPPTRFDLDYNGD